MALFDQIMGAIANPNQQGNPDQMGTILNTVQQVAGSRGLDPNATNTVLSVVGNYVRSSLQQQSSSGSGTAEAIVNQYAGTGHNPAAADALFSPSQQQQVAQAAAQSSGIDAHTIQSLLPVLVPIVLNLLKSGASAQGNAANAPGSNSVLNAFLDSDRDGDVDVGDMLSMAGRFMNQPR